MRKTSSVGWDTSNRQRDEPRLRSKQSHEAEQSRNDLKPFLRKAVRSPKKEASSRVAKSERKEISDVLTSTSVVVNAFNFLLYLVLFSVHLLSFSIANFWILLLHVLKLFILSFIRSQRLIIYSFRLNRRLCQAFHGSHRL
jgi:hypothetical protein